MKSIALLATLTVAALVCDAKSSSKSDDDQSKDSSQKWTPTNIKAPFIEQFDENWDRRWKSSGAVKQMPEDYKLNDDDNPEELFRYRGEWKVDKIAKGALPGDRALFMKTEGAHHAISVAFPKPVDPENKDLVVQYEVKFGQELRCTGAYIKLLTESKAGIKYHEFDDKTPYTIMFGPDMCGSTNKVHFIFRHKNPLNGKFQEKHFMHPPSIKNDLKSNLYTLIVHPNNTFHIYINQEREKTGNLLEDFDPAVNPPKELNDPKAKKPEDWVEEPKIPDPDAKKPADWDEDAPRMVPDDDAVKPDDWLEDEPEYIADPAAEKPEDWDDEEDGKWVAPQIANPACSSASGCGKWTPPMKPNPKYKGKWYAPLIDNPAYKGPWEAPKIPNPEYFEDLTPSKFNRIMGIGIENWVMQKDVQFDNFYVGHSVEDAKKFAEETWKVKRDLEDAEEAAARKAAEDAMAKEEDDESEEEEEEVAQPTDPLKPKKNKKKGKKSGKLSYKKVQRMLTQFMDALMVDPVKAVQKFPYVAGTVLAVVLTPLYLLMAFSGSKVKKVAKDAKSKASAAVVNGHHADGEAEEDEAQENEDKPRKRRVNKEE
ncbi:hypothetical protein MIR68_004604 [Amoeboaphelidium protococcarum]|nr:hypothetical protein MIR68_004604 [Amoeboaphelidium protococcarum]